MELPPGLGSILESGPAQLGGIPRRGRRLWCEAQAEISQKMMPGEAISGRGGVSPLTGDREMLWGRRRGDGTIVAVANRWSAPMPQPNDLSRSLVALDQDSTIIA